MIIETMTAAASTPRDEMSLWEPPVLDDLGSANLVAGNPLVGNDSFLSDS